MPITYVGNTNFQEQPGSPTWSNSGGSGKVTMRRTYRGRTDAEADFIASSGGIGTIDAEFTGMQLVAIERQGDAAGAFSTLVFVFEGLAAAGEGGSFTEADPAELDVRDFTASVDLNSNGANITVRYRRQPLEVEYFSATQVSVAASSRGQSYANSLADPVPLSWNPATYAIPEKWNGSSGHYKIAVVGRVTACEPIGLRNNAQGFRVREVWAKEMFPREIPDAFISG